MTALYKNTKKIINYSSFKEYKKRGRYTEKLYKWKKLCQRERGLGVNLGEKFPSQSSLNLKTVT